MKLSQPSPDLDDNTARSGVQQCSRFFSRSRGERTWTQVMTETGRLQRTFKAVVLVRLATYALGDVRELAQQRRPTVRTIMRFDPSSPSDAVVGQHVEVVA